MSVRTFEPRSEDYDVVVVGGGLSGLCAAIAAARHGAQTALVQDRPVLGGNSSSEVRVNPRGAGMSNGWARETGIVEELVLEERSRNHEAMGIGTMNSVWDTVLFEWVRKEPRLATYLNAAVDAVDVEHDRITAVMATQQGSESRIRFGGQVFVDCTGDGTVGALAGAEFAAGRESRDEYGETLAPPVRDEGSQGSTLLFRARDMHRAVPFVRPAWAHTYKGLSADYEDRVQRFLKSTDYGGFLWIEISVPYDTIRDNEEIRWQLLRHLFGVWDYVKNSGKYAAQALALDWIGAVVGKRESRRLLGDYVMKQDDVSSRGGFPDAVAYGGWWIDLHTVGGILTGSTIFQKRPIHDEEVVVRPFPIPYRCLYSRNVSNLMMAGRNVSATHVALGSLRIMLTCAVMGQAAGTAAYLAQKHRTTPREIGRSHMEELKQTLVKDDAFVPGTPSSDPDDLARASTLTASSTAALRLAPDGSVLSLDRAYAQIIPVSTHRLDCVWLHVATELAKDTEIELACERVDDIWDFRVPSRHARRAVAVVRGKTAGWVRFPIDADIQDGGLYQITLPRADGLSVGGARPATGVTAAWRKPEWHRRWHGARRVAIAMRPEPDQMPYGPENVINGTSRPEEWPNLWISSAEKDLPHDLTLAWSRPVSFNTLYLTFDTYLNEDPPELPALWRAPQCVRDYRVEAGRDGKWHQLLSVRDNYQRRRIHRFQTTTAGSLRLIVEATNGDPSARLYELRVYLEASDGDALPR